MSDESTLVKTTVQAHGAKLHAKIIRRNVEETPHKNPNHDQANLELADRLEAEGDAFLTLKEIPERGAGGELIVSGSKNIPALTVKNPDRVSLDASLDRVGLADKSGILNMALDAAESIGAKNPIEQMLAHQMAAAHRASLDLLTQAGNERNTVEKCRLINTAARLMDTYQKAMLTMHRVHTGGQQTVTVQHVQVKDGGQAVINGAVHTGGQLEGGNIKK